MKKLNSVRSLVLFLIISVFFSGCQSGFETVSSGQGSTSYATSLPAGSLGAGALPTGNSLGLEAFKNGFYAFTKQQGCVKCHASIVNPHFASADLSEAYTKASGFRNGSTNVKLIDFANPAASTFILYAGNNHCADTPCSDPAIRPMVQSFLVSWANAELAIQQPPPATGGPIASAPKFVTGGLPVPTGLPNLMTATPGVLRFPLSQLKPKVPGLDNAILEIEAQMVNPTEYRLSRPKIVGNSKALTFSGLHVYINAAANPGIGAEDESQTLNWHSTKTNAAIFALPNPLPKTPLAAVPLDNSPIYVQSLSISDVFTVGFDDIF